MDICCFLKAINNGIVGRLLVEVRGTVLNAFKEIA
jgi:hypothetical protein